MCNKKYGNQTKTEEDNLRCVEQEVCYVSFIYPNQKVKFNGNSMKIDPPM